MFAISVNAQKKPRVCEAFSAIEMRFAREMPAVCEVPAGDGGFISPCFSLLPLKIGSVRRTLLSESADSSCVERLAG
jgi:hypothetical protein